ncbi:MAG: transglycosylase domain-containing protein, partial [Spirochaetia bacterium]|nr:transglycosylase domain-containing protein [Spirochaetia bacterium]
THYGFNPWRIIKAFFVDIITLRAEQGGSTITIQLSKLLFLDHKKSIKRKFFELWYAIQIERLYTKKEILWFYFNQVNYGHGCYGVEAASKFFFNKHARDLSVAECALLAGIPKSPTYYSPLRYPKQSMQRHRVVLAGLVHGKYLTSTEAFDHYEDFWIDFTSRIRSRESTVSDLEAPEAPYFVEYVRDRLEKIFDRNQLYKGGLVVYTTLNLDHQRAAEKYLKEKLDEQNKSYKETMGWVERQIDANVFDQVQAFASSFFIPIDTARSKRLKKAEEILYDDIKEPLRSVALLLGQSDLFGALQNAPDSAGLDEKVECAFISIEPGTGYITAMSGGSGFHYNNQFNHVFLAKRQIGSAVKPFIYAPALDKKIITPATLLADVPIAIGEGRSDELYTPNNYGGDYVGNILVRDALRRSINTCALRVLDMVTPETVREYAKKIFDIRTDAELYEKFPRNFTMGLGSGSFTPFDMVNAFGIFAN